jgi:hypothetical protein
MYRRLIITLLAFALVGCATAGSGEGRERRDATRLTLEELRTAPRTNALEVVQTLRPQWLRVRGPTSFEATRESVIMVYVDGTRVGGPDVLRTIPVPNIESMQYLNPNEASARYGFDHLNGAILVTTRVGREPRGT